MDAVIATTPAGMLVAQTTMQGWIAKKLDEAKRELSTAESVYNALDKAKLRTAPASTQIRKARLRITFYEKVGAALDAGYYLIPPFEVQVFAIRTKRDAPLEDRSQQQWVGEQDPQRLPVGEGEYRPPEVDRNEVDSFEKKNADGTKTEVAIYENADWGELELPLRAMKPTIIEATREALEAKIFDSLGIAPSYRASDPIIVGQIKHWKQNRSPLTFFVAWWTDEDDL